MRAEQASFDNQESRKTLTGCAVPLSPGSCGHNCFQVRVSGADLAKKAKGQTTIDMAFKKAKE